VVLGSGPNRIGQGIEFDYSCVHGVLAAKELGYETIMINCNPETVSTDFDTADKLYFEPVFWEHIYDIIQHEQPEGVIVQLGGQTALKLAEKLEKYGTGHLETPRTDGARRYHAVRRGAVRRGYRNEVSDRAATKNGRMRASDHRC